MKQNTSFTANRITVNLDELRMLSLAQALEETPDVDRASIEDATLKASHRLGENPDVKSFLLERAKLIIDASTVPFSRSRKHKFGAPLMLLFFLAVFLAGVFSERIGALEHSLNLLSLPFFGLLAWNFVCYTVLTLSAFGILREGHFSFRKTLVACIQKIHVSEWRATKTHSLYLSHISENLTEYLRLCVAKYLHVAAALFALGLITGLMVRGVSTSYWAVWESTWFYDDAQSVKWILDHTYGLIPAIVGLPPLPDIETVAQMQLENAAYVKTGFSAAPWIIRCATLIVFFVVIPRAVLFVSNHLRSSSALQKIPFSITTPYAQNALKQGTIGRMTGDIVFLTHRKENDYPEKLTSIATAWGDSQKDTVHTVDFSLQTPSLPNRFSQEKSHLLMIVFSAKDTPEDDLHGTFADTVLAAYGKTTNIRVAAFLDARSLQNQYRHLPQRTKERTELWTRFFDAHRLPYYVFTDTTDNPKTIAHDIRSWANQTLERFL